MKKHGVKGFTLIKLPVRLVCQTGSLSLFFLKKIYKRTTSLRPRGRASRFFYGCKKSSSHLHTFTQSAFTLIELLVVIAIICTLATMLFPVVSSMQERGRQSVCLNNIRQIALQHLLYADANGGLFCPAWDTEKKQWDASADYRSAGILAQSISAADRGSGEIFACPETKFKLTQKKSYAPQYAGYGYNYLLSFANVNARPPNYRFVSTAKVTAPARVVIAADAAYLLSRTEAGPTSYLYNTSSGKGGFADFRHPGGAVAVYVDGHAAVDSAITPSRSAPENFRERIGYLSEDDSAYDPFFKD